MADVSDTDLLNAMSSNPSDVSDAQLLGQMGGLGQSTPPPTTSGAKPPDAWNSFGAGLIQGGRNVVSSFDPIAQYLDKKIGHVTLGGLLPTADQAHANNLAARSQFNQQYGDSTAAGLGQVGGEIAGSLPAMAAGGEVLGPLAAGLSRVAPAVAPAVNFLSGAAKGNKLLKMASTGAQGALQGTAAAGLTSGGSDQPIGQQLTQGAETGGLLGGAGPAAMDAGGALYNKLTGGGISPLKAALADKAINQFGIPLRGSQISNSPFAHYLDSTVGKIPFSGLEAQNEAQRTAFSRAVAGTFGENADSLTPDVMSGARKRIGQVFNSVAARTGIKDTAGLAQTLSGVIGEASQALPEGSVAPLMKQVENIGSLVDSDGTMSGKAYQSLTRKGAPLDRAMNSSDSNVRHYAGQIRDALDDALESSASPDDIPALKKARLQWKNMRTVQDLASKAEIEGEITPTALLGAVKKSYKDMAYSGAGDIGDLAHIGQQFLSSPPSSGTGERLAMYEMIKGLGGGGIADATLLHDPNAILHTAATGAGILGAGKVIGSTLKSHLYRDWLLNSAVRQHGGNALFGGSTQIPGGINKLALPAGVIGANNLLFNRAPVPSSQ